MREIKHVRRHFSPSAAIIALAGLVGANGLMLAKPGGAGPANHYTIEDQQMASEAIQLPVEGEMPSLGSMGEWLNSKPVPPLLDLENAFFR